jgi:AcrR family transcriptional regulator
MPKQPFHHGNLREVMLGLAADALREGGLDQLSLRELARRAGVTHAAPRRHFADRQALLDALAADGFRRLTARMTTAGETGSTYRVRFRAVADAFVTFATEEAALLELMFLSKSADASEELQEEAERFFAANAAFYATAPRGSRRSSADNARRQRLLVPTLQGIATLAAAGRVSRDDVETLLDDATELFA